jgi:hypothetical protein
VNAHTYFQFQRWETKLTKIEFGGFCVSDADCLAGYECTNDVCVPKGSEPKPPGAKGNADYCEEKIKGTIQGVTAAKCVLGEGGCKTGECDQNLLYNANEASGDSTAVALECRTIGTRNICCPGDAQSQQCQAASDAWMQGKTGPEIELAMKQAYTPPTI